MVGSFTAKRSAASELFLFMPYAVGEQIIKMVAIVIAVGLHLCHSVVNIVFCRTCDMEFTTRVVYVLVSTNLYSTTTRSVTISVSNSILRFTVHYKRRHKAPSY